MANGFYLSDSVSKLPTDDCPDYFAQDEPLEVRRRAAFVPHTKASGKISEVVPGVNAEIEAFKPSDDDMTIIRTEQFTRSISSHK